MVVRKKKWDGVWTGGGHAGGISHETRHEASVGSVGSEPRNTGLRGRPTGEDCRPRGRHAGSGGSVPGLLRGDELAGAAGGEFAVFGADGFGQDAHCGGGGGDIVWGAAGGDQGGLCGVSALA